MNRNLVIPLLFVLFVTLCVVDSKKGSKSGGQGNKNKEDIKILVPGGKKPGKDVSNLLYFLKQIKLQRPCLLFYMMSLY